MHEQAYVQIAKNVDKNFQTAPKADEDLSQAFIAYLKIVYTPEEAELVQHLFMPPVFKTLEELADATNDLLTGDLFDIERVARLSND